MATNPLPTIPQTKAAAQALLDKLYDANPTTLADSETVSDTIVAVNAVLTQLNQEDWSSRTASMQAAAADLKGPLEDLSKLKDALAGVAKRVETLSDVVKEVESVVGGCRSIFGI
jgi:hypothetical protein